MLGTMMRNVAVAVGLMALAIVGLYAYSGLMDAKDGASVARDNARLASARRGDRVRPAPPPRQQSGDDGNSMVIEAGQGGHYYVDAEINGTDIHMVVDTGATVIALSTDDAERLGIAVHQLEYDGRANTANGVARTARVMLDEVTLGDITVRDVPAVIIEAPMQISLLGMSFLRRLAGFSVERGKLLLRR